MVRPAHAIRVLVSPLLVPRRPMSPIMVMLESNDGSMVLLKVHRLVDAVLSLTSLVLGCVPNVRVYSVPACVLPKHELFLGIMAIGMPVVAPVTFLLCYIGRITIRWYNGLVVFCDQVHVLLNRVLTLVKCPGLGCYIGRLVVTINVGRLNVCRLLSGPVPSISKLVDPLILKELALVLMLRTEVPMVAVVRRVLVGSKLVHVISSLSLCYAVHRGMNATFALALMFTTNLVLRVR